MKRQASATHGGSATCRGTLGAHRSEIRREAMIAAEISAAGQTTFCVIAAIGKALGATPVNGMPGLSILARQFLECFRLA